eukprot:gene18932-19269_t
MMDHSVAADEAARILGVSKQTLYAYVSRGLVPTLPKTEGKESRYPREAVEQLSESRRLGRRPKEIVKKAIDWGAPVLETQLSYVENERLFYRGADAIELSLKNTLEETACLLWNVEMTLAFARDRQASVVMNQALLDGLGQKDVLSRFAWLSSDEGTAAWESWEKQVIVWNPRTHDAL